MKTEDLQKLKSKQPLGYRKAIANSIGCSEGYVDKVLNGKSQNEKIIDLAIELAEEKQKADRKRTERVKAL